MFSWLAEGAVLFLGEPQGDETRGGFKIPACHHPDLRKAKDSQKRPIRLLSRHLTHFGSVERAAHDETDVLNLHPLRATTSLAQAARAGMKALGLLLFAPDAYSDVATAVKVPAGVDEEAGKVMRAIRYGVTIAGRED